MHSLERIKADNAELVASRFLDAAMNGDAVRVMALLNAAPDLRAYIEAFRGQSG